jgi:lipopolysaccharide biosynthesis glycosyltransferase
MSFDENYAMNACVAIYSLLRSKAKDTYYHIYIIIREKFSSTVLESFDSLVKQYIGTIIEYVEIGTVLDNSTAGQHFTTDCNFRLIAADLFPNLDKCIHLDVDIVVLDDLTQMWNIDIGDNIIAGIRDINGKERFKVIKLPTWKQYVNSGVIIMNLKVIRDENITPRFVELLDKGYFYPDQDILNKICYDRIYHLPLKYNIYFYQVVNKKELELIYSPDDIEDALNNPVIIHYAGGIKPWNSSDDYAMLSYLWYQAAIESPVKYNHTKHLLKGRYDSKLKQSFYENQVSRYRDSTAYKIGRIILFLPRVIKKLIGR